MRRFVDGRRDSQDDRRENTATPDEWKISPGRLEAERWMAAVSAAVTEG